MIIGVGIDTVNIDRIATLCKKSQEAFIKKIFSAYEQDVIGRFQEDSEKLYSHIAKRFAAKEAFSKALGTGIGANAAFKEITIVNHKNGSPYIELTGNAQNFLRCKTVKYKIHLSLSDDHPNATALVIIESL